MKKIAIIPIFLMIIMGVALAYIQVTIEPLEVAVLPGESNTVDAIVSSDLENYQMDIECTVYAFDADGNYLGAKVNDAEDCPNSVSDVEIVFDDGSIEKEGFSGDNTEEITITLNSTVAEGTSYTYTVNAGSEARHATVIADVNVIPEFSTLTALTALVGTGIVFGFLRRKNK